MLCHTYKGFRLVAHGLLFRIFLLFTRYLKTY